MNEPLFSPRYALPTGPEISFWERKKAFLTKGVATLSKNRPNFVQNLYKNLSKKFLLATLHIAFSSLFVIFCHFSSLLSKTFASLFVQKSQKVTKSDEKSISSVANIKIFDMFLDKIWTNFRRFLDSVAAP